MSEAEFALKLIRMKDTIEQTCLELREKVPPMLEVINELLQLVKPYASPSPWGRDLNHEWASLLAVEKALKELQRVLARW
jgi:hypothetical protein